MMPLTALASTSFVPLVSISTTPLTVVARISPSVPREAIFPLTVVSSSETLAGTRRL